MRTSLRRGLALTAAVGLLLAGCGDDESQEDSAGDEQAEDDRTAGEDSGGEGDGPDEQELEDMLDEQGMADPNEDVEDGVYRGNGVTLPVPEGWSLDPMAFQQGIVAAMSEDGSQQMSARAMDVGEAGAADDQSMELDSVLDNVRQQVEQEAETDEEVDLAGADRAHQLTYRELPAEQEEQPDSGVTLVLAEGGESLLGEFTYTAAEDAYDNELASLLVDEAGFDPDSEPPEMPQAQPAPEGEGGESQEPGSDE